MACFALRTVMTFIRLSTIANSSRFLARGSTIPITQTICLANSKFILQKFLIKIWAEEAESMLLGHFQLLTPASC